MWEAFQTGLIGAGAGVVTGLTGFFKNRDSKDGFQIKKLGVTVVISGMAGFVIGLQGMNVTDASMASITAAFGAVGVTEWVSNILKGVFK